MHVLANPSEMRAWSRAERARGRRIGFVPTMGFLHEGHLRLVDRARERTDRVVMSIFVNPLQFGAGEDFTTYPRDVERDKKLASERGVECLFLPDANAMYPADPRVRLHPGPMADGLEGAARPGHFAGVLTVVAKLFHLVEPDIAVFGRKDFQQAMLVSRMAVDLDFGLEIDIAPTVRELDGLALSSRNSYLNADQRRAALGGDDGPRWQTHVVLTDRSLVIPSPSTTLSIKRVLPTFAATSTTVRASTRATGRICSSTRARYSGATPGARSTSRPRRASGPGSASPPRHACSTARSARDRASAARRSSPCR